MDLPKDNVPKLVQFIVTYSKVVIFEPFLAKQVYKALFFYFVMIAVPPESGMGTNPILFSRQKSSTAFLDPL